MRQRPRDIRMRPSSMFARLGSKKTRGFPVPLTSAVLGLPSQCCSLHVGCLQAGMIGAETSPPHRTLAATVNYLAFRHDDLAVIASCLPACLASNAPHPFAIMHPLSSRNCRLPEIRSTRSSEIISALAHAHAHVNKTSSQPHSSAETFEASHANNFAPLPHARERTDSGTEENDQGNEPGLIKPILVWPDGNGHILSPACAVCIGTIESRLDFGSCMYPCTRRESHVSRNARDLPPNSCNTQRSRNEESTRQFHAPSSSMRIRSQLPSNPSGMKSMSRTWPRGTSIKLLCR